MNTYLKSMLCVLLSLFCLISTVSCGGETTPGSTESGESGTNTTNGDAATGGDSSGNGTKPVETDPKVFFKPKGKTYDRDFVFAGTGQFMDYYMVDENYKAGNGSVIQEAAYKRNVFMSDIHGVNVKMKKIELSSLEVSVLADMHVADLAVYTNDQQFSYLTKGIYLDVLPLQSLNLSAPYWDQMIQEQLMVGDSLYMIEGDFSFVDQLRTGAFLFNASVYSAQGYDDTYGSLYELVDEGKWTQEILFEMSNGMYKDNNNSGTKDEADTYGIICGTGLVWALFSGSGMKLVESKHGEIELLISDPSRWQSVYSAIEDIVGKCVGVDDVANPQLWTGDVWTHASNVFENGNALFRYTALSAALRLSNTACTFGVLPVPKYTQEQTQYYNIASPKGVFHGALLSSIPDREVAAEILDALCYYSRYGGTASLYDAYFETFRLNKFCGTPDDLRMLELLFSTTFYDLDYAADITQIPQKHIISIEMTEDTSKLYSTLHNALNSAQIRLDEFKIAVAALKS